MAVELRDGRPVLVRTGGDELRREAERLVAAAGPGVPQVLEVDDDGTEVRLVTEVHPPLAAGRSDAVRVAAAVAAVLARAHAAGVAHGPLLDEHLRGPVAAVVVDGWGTGGAASAREDVAEVGALLDRLAGGDPSLRPLVERAAAPGRPSMAAYALALGAAVPVARPGREAGRSLPSLPPAARRTVLAGSGAAAALTVVGLVVAGLEAPPAPGPAAGRPAAATTTTATTVVVRGPVAGGVLEHEGARWAAGEPGDVVVVGDWTCNGSPTPALLRPSTGEVWLFPSWAEQPGTPLATVPRAATARVVRTGRCDRLEVLDGDGQSTLVAT